MPISATLRRRLEHAQGVVVLEGDTNDPKKPNYESESYQRQIEDTTFCRVVYGGTKVVRAVGSELLPQFPAEEDEDYKRRLKRAVIFNAFKRTVHGLVGMAFRKEPTWSVLPDERTAEETLNIDLLGHEVSVFARERAIDAFIDGHTWILVDYPRTETQATSRAQELAAGLRPYWVPILKQDAINVQYEQGPDGQPVLTLFAYKYEKTRPHDEFGEEVVTAIRVLRPGSFQEWERNKDGWVMVDEGVVTLPIIPVAFVPSNETMPFESDPPLLDLAYENIDHYQIRSDHRWAAMFASVPLPVFFNMKPEQVVWGANRALFAQAENADAKLLESSGASLESTRLDLKDSEARMAALGLQMLVGEKRAAETAQAKLIGKSESDSVLAAMVTAVENGLNRALAIHAMWTNAAQAKISLNNDFHDLQFAPAQVSALSQMVSLGQLSLETMWSALVKGEVLPDDFDPEVERVMLDALPDDELDEIDRDTVSLDE